MSAGLQDLLNLFFVLVLVVHVMNVEWFVNPMLLLGLANLFPFSLHFDGGVVNVNDVQRITLLLQAPMCLNQGPILCPMQRTASDAFL